MNPLRGSARSRYKKCPRDPLRDRRARGTKTRGFLRYLRCPKPSARIGVVEVQRLELFLGFAFLRCADEPSACRRALAAAPCEFVLVSANPLRRSCVETLSLWRCAFCITREMAFGSCLEVLPAAVAGSMPSWLAEAPAQAKKVAIGLLAAPTRKSQP